MKTIRTAALLLGLAGAAALTVLIVSTAPKSVDSTLVPSKTTFDLLLTSQTQPDRATIRSYTGESRGDLTDGRLLGTDPSSEKYLLVVSNTQACLVVLDSATESGAACDPPARVGQGHLAGVHQRERRVTRDAHPDEYADTAIAAAAKVLLHEKNLVVVSAAPDQSQTLVLGKRDVSRSAGHHSEGVGLGHALGSIGTSTSGGHTARGAGFHALYLQASPPQVPAAYRHNDL